MNPLNSQDSPKYSENPVSFGRVLIVLAAAVVTIAGMRAASDFIVPVLLAAFLATISFPITSWLRRHRVPRFLAVMATVVVNFAFLAAVIFVALSLLGDLQSKWDMKYKRLTRDKVEQATDSITRVMVNMNVPDAEKRVDEYFNKKANETLQQLEFAKVWDVGTDVVGRIAGFFGTSFLVFLLTVFMLTEARMFGRRLNAIRVADGPNFQRMMSAVHDIQRFLGIKTIVSLATGIIAGVVCMVADLDFPILWGILAFALNYIPVVGSVIAGLPPIILAGLVHGGWSAFGVGLGYVGINVFLGNFLEPTLMGRRFGLSTMIVILAVLFWGFVWGPVGMLLAVPITMMLKVALDNSSDFRWIAIAISKDKEIQKTNAKERELQAIATVEKIVEEKA